MAPCDGSFSSQVTTFGHVPFCISTQRAFIELNGPLSPSRVVERKHFLQVLFHFTRAMHTPQKTHWKEVRKSPYFSSANPSICKMASSQPTDVFAFIFHINCQYLKARRTPGESTRKKQVEKHIFNKEKVQRGKGMFLIEKKNVARLSHHYDLKQLFLKCWTPFSISLPFYVTASGQIVRFSYTGKKNGIMFWLPKGQFPGKGHKFKPLLLYGMRRDNSWWGGHHKGTQEHQPHGQQPPFLRAFSTESVRMTQNKLSPCHRHNAESTGPPVGHFHHHCSLGRAGEVRVVLWPHFSFHFCLLPLLEPSVGKLFSV